MGLTQLIVVVILGATQVAPLSSAAHSYLIGFAPWPIPSPALALAISVGLLLGVMAYLWRDLFGMGVGVVRAAKGKRDPGARLTAQILAGSIPAIGIAFAIDRYLDPQLRSPMMLGWVTVGSGVLLLALDRMSMTIKRLEHASYIDTVIVGLAQIIALVPGVSRSGITMTLARLLGYERAEAARLSLLLGIPAMLAVIVVQLLALLRDDALVIDGIAVLAGFVSFLTGLITMAIMMAWLQRRTFMPFALYRILIGAGILALAYGWVALP